MSSSVQSEAVLTSFSIVANTWYYVGITNSTTNLYFFIYSDPNYIDDMFDGPTKFPKKFVFAYFFILCRLINLISGLEIQVLQARPYTWLNSFSGILL